MYCGCCGVNRTEQLFCSACSTHLVGGASRPPWDRINPDCPVRAKWEAVSPSETDHREDA